MKELAPLFTPFTVRGLTLRNRFIMSPMQMHEPPDRIPPPEMSEYYRARIRGGVALILTQGTAVDHPTSQSTYVGFFPATHEGWKRCTDAVRAEGGHIFMQLWHEGARRVGGFGPSGISPPDGAKQGEALSRQQIGELVEIFAKSAYDAKQLGFSGVEIHGAHGYLVDQFFYDVSNRRSDEYGGSFENRMRFGLEIVRAVRAAVGSDFPISMRISQSKGRNQAPRPYPTPEVLRSFLLPLKEAGVDIFHASTRRFSEAMFEGSDMGFAGWVKKESGMPVITVGCVGLDKDMSAVMFGETAHAAGRDNLLELARRFNRGDFDLVAVGRAVLTDPEWVNKARDGRFSEMRQELTYKDIFGALSYKMPESDKAIMAKGSA